MICTPPSTGTPAPVPYAVTAMYVLPSISKSSTKRGVSSVENPSTPSRITPLARNSSVAVLVNSIICSASSS